MNNRNNSVIRMPHADIIEIKKLLDEGKTITAVKHCRKHGKHYVDGVEQFRPGQPKPRRMSLRAAKHAIDVFRGHPPQGVPEAVFAPPVEIKSIKVATIEGEFEFDLDELQLKLLDGLDTLPLSVLSHSAELIQYIRDWQDNFKLGE
tara:strand:- start:2318 stop:2758 length:441 start_codon:yes stop_codon:yes gene_type:complete